MDFGLDPLEAELGDVYFLFRTVVDPAELGWAGHRQRQIVFALLKSWVLQMVPIGVPKSIDALNTMFNFQQLIALIFHRKCRYTYKGYLIANSDELMADKAWAKGRPCACAQEDGSGSEFTDCLTPAERRRLDVYINAWPNEVYDLNQDPHHRPIKSFKGILPTLLRSMGVLWCHDERRFLALPEILSSMGYPISEAAQEASKASCQFSRGAGSVDRTPPTRSHKSVCEQVGNAVHVNTIAAALFLVVLLFPHFDDPGNTMEQITRRQKQQAPSQLQKPGEQIDKFGIDGVINATQSKFAMRFLNVRQQLSVASKRARMHDDVGPL